MESYWVGLILDRVHGSLVSARVPIVIRYRMIVIRYRIIVIRYRI